MCQGSPFIALAEGIQAGSLAPYAAKHGVHKVLGHISSLSIFAGLLPGKH